MPIPNETEREYVARCVPMLIAEGKTPAQAVATCHAMYDEHKKPAVAASAGFVLNLAGATDATPVPMGLEGYADRERRADPLPAHEDRDVRAVDAPRHGRAVQDRPRPCGRMGPQQHRARRRRRQAVRARRAPRILQRQGQPRLRRARRARRQRRVRRRRLARRRRAEARREATAAASTSSKRRQGRQGNVHRANPCITLHSYRTPRCPIWAAWHASPLPQTARRSTCPFHPGGCDPTGVRDEQRNSRRSSARRSRSRPTCPTTSSPTSPPRRRWRCPPTWRRSPPTATRSRASATPRRRSPGPVGQRQGTRRAEPVAHHPQRSRPTAIAWSRAGVLSEAGMKELDALLLPAASPASSRWRCRPARPTRCTAASATSCAATPA
jgi:hypothetical protein